MPASDVGATYVLGGVEITVPSGGAGDLCNYHCDLGWKEIGTRGYPASDYRFYSGGGCEYYHVPLFSLRMQLQHVLVSLKIFAQ